MTTAEKKQLDDDGLDLIFRNARTHKVWLSLCLQPGYGDASKLFPRSLRLDFDEACRIA